MILSMTGFGRGTAATATKHLTAEIKSLNSKQLDLNIRVPGLYRELEISLRGQFTEALQRGKVEATGTVEADDPGAPLHLNESAMAAYKSQIEHASQTLGLPLPDDWYAVLTRLPEAFTAPGNNQQQIDEETQAFTRAFTQALENLLEFRKLEGEKLEVFFRKRIANISALLEEIKPLAEERVPKIRARIEENLAKLALPEYDADRLEAEMIFYIEKLDVTEEQTRLQAHLDYFLSTLSLPQGGQGKKLGFITQEMGREINTLGSKANHSGMQQIVVKMKDELEQIKEQVLNVL